MSRLPMAKRVTEVRPRDMRNVYSIATGESLPIDMNDLLPRRLSWLDWLAAIAIGLSFLAVTIGVAVLAIVLL